VNIGLIGTFDVNNFGDCLFPELYAHLLTQAEPDVALSFYSPTDQKAAIYSFDTLKALPAHLDAVDTFTEDALVLVGGETVGLGHSSGTYNYPRASLSSYLRLWMAPMMAALDPKSATRFFAAHCVGAIKMPPEHNALVAQAMGGAGYASFRDAFSVSWIQSGETTFDREVDPMFLIDDLRSAADWRALAQDHLPAQFLEDGYIAAQISLGYGNNDLRAWCDAVTEIAKTQNKHVLLLPICHFLGDEEVLSKALPHLQAAGVTAHLAKGLLNVKATAALLGCSDGYIGSSLHGAVSAVAFAKPLAVLGHSMDGKHEGSLRNVGINGAVCITPADLVGCFATTAAMDMGKARAHAQGMARKSFDRFLTALRATNTQSADRQDQARKAAQALVHFETTQHGAFSAYEIKRHILRWLVQRPALYRSYRKLKDRRRMQIDA